MCGFTLYQPLCHGKGCQNEVPGAPRKRIFVMMHTCRTIKGWFRDKGRQNGDSITCYDIYEADNNTYTSQWFCKQCHVSAHISLNVPLQEYPFDQASEYRSFDDPRHSKATFIFQYEGVEFIWSSIVLGEIHEIVTWPQRSSHTEATEATHVSGSHQNPSAPEPIADFDHSRGFGIPYQVPEDPNKMHVPHGPRTWVSSSLDTTEDWESRLPTQSIKFGARSEPYLPIRSLEVQPRTLRGIGDPNDEREAYQYSINRYFFVSL